MSAAGNSREVERAIPWEDMATLLSRWLVRIAVAFWVLFLLAPVIVPVAVSFTATEYPIFPPRDLSLRWYRQALEYEWFRRSLVVSLIVAVGSTALAVGMGLLAARVLTRYRFGARSAFEYLMLSPLVIPSVVLGFALFNVVVQFGLQGTALLNLMVGHALVTIPFTLRTCWSSMVGTDARLEEAAQSLGATPWATFWFVTLPSIMPGVVAGAIIAFTFSFNDVTISAFLSGPQSRPLPIELMSQMEHAGNASPAAITSIIMFMTIFFFVLVERTVGLDVFAQK